MYCWLLGHQCYTVILLNCCLMETHLFHIYFLLNLKSFVIFGWKPIMTAWSILAIPLLVHDKNNKNERKKINPKLVHVS